MSEETFKSQSLRRFCRIIGVKVKCQGWFQFTLALDSDPRFCDTRADVRSKSRDVSWVKISAPTIPALAAFKVNIGV
jgi:hypothetical protein